MSLQRLGSTAVIGATLLPRFRPWMVWLTRAIWLALVVLSLSLAALTIPARQIQLLIIGAQNSIALDELGLAPQFFLYYIGFWDILLFFTYVLVGAVIFQRKSREWIGLFASLTLITIAVTAIRPSDSLLFVEPALRIPLLVVFDTGVISAIVFIFIFPDGRYQPRWTVWISLVFTTYASWWFFSPLILSDELPWPPPPTSPLLVLGILIAALFQVYRYARCSTPEQKEQTRWVVFGILGAAVGMTIFLLVIPTLVPDVLFPGMERVLYIILGLPFFYIALLLFPAALGLSFLRYRLWGIDLLLNRTLVYVPLTAILAGMFAAFETVTQRLFVALTGTESDLASVISTLLVVGAFTPVKEGLQNLVDRRLKAPTAPHERLRDFAQQVKERVSPIHAPIICRRLVAQAVTAFDAVGGASFVHRSGELHLLETIGVWDNTPQVEVLVQSSPQSHLFGKIALAKRKNDLPYTEQDRRVLEEVSQSIARALEEDLDALT